MFWFTISILFLTGVAALWLRKRLRMKQARSWPTATGAVAATSVTLRSGGAQPGSAAYYAEIRYSYVVAGQNYPGTLRQRFILKGRADKWIENYANCKQLTVRYNPRKTKDSLLLADDLDAPISSSN
ncbi:MAG TPA: DUF3592 domain-containing protein [Terracidiphilus sp.]|nr:DUF3592 domain-containing protein [Terracidiphilus sp.]